MSEQRPTPETDAYIGDDDGSFMTEGEIAMFDFARKLERERNEAVESLAKLKVEYSDLVDRFNNTTSRQLDMIQAQEIKIGNLRAALAGRTVSCSQCNETTKQLDAMRDELQKVCQQRDAWAMRCDKLGVTAMREAIKEAHDAIDLQLFVRGTKDDTTQVRSQMEAARSKLQPFLKP